VTQISVIGKGTPDPELAPLAEEVGRRLAEPGATVVCGGLGGVMEAAARGAREAGGEVIGVLPGDNPDLANEHVTRVVATGVGHARNLAVVGSGRAVIAVGGEWGTLAEIAFARRLGRPVVALESWSVSGPGAMAGGPGVMQAASAAGAVDAALRLAREGAGQHG
jgi:uncharacterized protein (TIGR00725 family)